MGGRPIKGSLGVASAFQLTEQMEALDKKSKNLLSYKEVLAVILKFVVEEYQDYTFKEVMDFIEEDRITDTQEVSRDRTNTRVLGKPTEFPELGEKTTFFDRLIRAKNPRLSKPGLHVALHIDFEPQRDYRPGYPIEKRGVYYLSRSCSSQLGLLTEHTDYGQLEKCYSIWICRDNIPKNEQMSISFYGLSNMKNIGDCNPKREDYDLLQLIIIRLGNRDYQCEGQDLLEFLTAIFYPHSPGFRKKISKYIDVDSCLKEEEANHMFRLSECIYQDGREEGREEGIEMFILDNMEECVSRERIIEKLQRRFRLNQEEAEAYFERYALTEI